MSADGEELGEEAWSLAGMADGESFMTLLLVALKLTFDAALHMEFLCTRAWSCRYAEEVNFIIEEKRRTLVSLEGVALAWNRRRKETGSVDDPVLRQGSTAYATEQATMYWTLAKKFKRVWLSDVTRLLATSPPALPTVMKDPTPSCVYLDDRESEVWPPVDINSDDEPFIWTKQTNRTVTTDSLDIHVVNTLSIIFYALEKYNGGHTFEVSVEQPRT